MADVFKPLIKYTGGKYDEYKYFEKEIPDNINNYYEPFFGGGGVFFQLHNAKKINGGSYINDISKDLMDFYGNVANKGFLDEIMKLSVNWDCVKAVAEKTFGQFGEAYFDVILGRKDISWFINDSLMDFLSQTVNSFDSLRSYNTHGFSIVNRMYDGLNDKTKRFIKKDISEEETDLPYKSITTAIHQAFYFIVRDMYNDWLLGSEGYTQEEKSAQWFFIREFCYGSMFRFSRDGKFNIPYGGFGYNSKCFSCKVDEIRSEKVQSMFKTVNISCLDFEKFLDRDFKEGDFIFLDPPYDSTFSEYDNNSFTRDDQTRLRDTLSKLKCKWLLVIRKTDFISGLYKDYEQVPFNKTYSYHARGTYDDKNCTHIAIKTY